MSRLARRPIAGLAALALPAAAARTARAHGAIEASGPGSLWSAPDAPELLCAAMLITLAAGYGLGVRRLWRHAGIGRGVRRFELASFAAGWLALALALVSPLHRLGEQLFSAHMAQHELLMLVAAPLLALARPMTALLWALPAAGRRRIGALGRVRTLRAGWRCLTHPVVAWCVHAAALWAWHAPVMFQATLASDLVHAAQHASFFGSALLFWWALLQRGPGVASYGAALLFVFTTSLHGGLLAVLLTLAPTAWYPAYASSAAAWGLTALEDQQLGGLLMWVPGATLYLIAALALLAGWLREARVRARTRRWELA